MGQWLESFSTGELENGWVRSYSDIGPDLWRWGGYPGYQGQATVTFLSDECLQYVCQIRCGSVLSLKVLRCTMLLSGWCPPEHREGLHSAHRQQCHPDRRARFDSKQCCTCFSLVWPLWLRVAAKVRRKAAGQ